MSPMKPRLLCLAASLLAAGSGPALATSAADADSAGAWYFYRGRDYGSEGLVNPWRLVLNGGFGILKMENRSNRLGDIDFENGWDNLWRNLGDPVTAIEQKGWWDFLRSEVIPISINEGNAQYWPNYLNHLVGGGMSYRMMREWYRWHGFRHERTWALGTIWAYHLLNETVEMNNRTGWRVDPIADVYLFNWAGIMLFSSDRVSRFFSHTLNMADWSFLPLYDPERGTLENNGQNFMIRFRWRRTSPWLVFYHWGNSGELGLSRHLGGGRYLSFGGGFEARKLVEVDRFSETADLATTLGLFYDREGSLLASVLYAKTMDNRWRVNLYPGLLATAGLCPGLTFIVTQDNDVLLGLTFGTLPLPTGLGRRF
jgi:hypothetical protein